MRYALSLILFLFLGNFSYASEPISLNHARSKLELLWQARIQSFLDQGKLPKIDMETSFKQNQVERYIPDIFDVMDELGIALFAADGYQRPKDGSGGYRWSYYIREVVNNHPDRFIPTANGGTNPNWLKEKGGSKNHYIDQMEKYVRAGVYLHMGEFDFRHYMSSGQCKRNRLDRDSKIPLDSKNGHRLFLLAEETGTPFVIHLEPEDVPLDTLEKMLAKYPKAKVIIAHFGQLRHPEKQKRFTPKYVRQLLETNPNLYFDLSIGHPNRKYTCAGETNDEVLIGDNTIWEKSEGRQTDTVKVEWRNILSDFSGRFVFATDYGGGRPPLERFLRYKVNNFKRIVRDLPDRAKQDIAYRNAWKLLTGKEWK